MRLETERLIITDFTLDMVEDVWKNSLDDNNRRFVPDEVFETPEDAEDTVSFLMEQYGGTDGPLVHPIITKEGRNAGYVQIVPIEEGWEIGYHVALDCTGRGYATEAVKTFLPFMAEKLGIREVWGICLADNLASVKILEKNGFEKVFEGIGSYQGEDREIMKYLWKRL